MQYGMDVQLPDMRVATIMAAPIRGGKLVSVDPAPAMAVKGVEKVIKLENAVAVVANGYWPALQGLRALSPKFSDGGNGAISTASIFAAHDALRKAGEIESEAGAGDVEAGLKTSGAKRFEADFRLPFLHHAMMEPFALTAHHKDGKLDIWGGLQDPLATKMAAVKFSGLSADDVTFHPMASGGSFGRRLPMYVEIVEQVSGLAMQGAPYAVGLRSWLADGWTDGLAEGFEASGFSRDRARELAQESLAMARGLLFELAVTGDRASVDAAMGRYTAAVRELPPT